ncbi:TMEM165/GDT1 family protein [Candidatus Bipolaricaulota bacterium]|nr:TMEM165/GDT1 family protein [Candidatus Bipolaricaulota bacterium]
MDIATAAAAFGLIFLAELGDKTQLAILAMAADRSPISVFLGASLALLASTAIAVALGALAKGFLPEGALRWLRYGAGALFIGFGLWTILRG